MLLMLFDCGVSNVSFPQLCLHGKSRQSFRHRDISKLCLENRDYPFCYFIGWQFTFFFRFSCFCGTPVTNFASRYLLLHTLIARRLSYCVHLPLLFHALFDLVLFLLARAIFRNYFGEHFNFSWKIVAGKRLEASNEILTGVNE